MRTVITRSAAGGIEIALPVTTLSVTPSTLLPSPLLLLPPRRPLAYCLARRLTRATFSFHAGALDVRPPLMCLSSARYRSSPSLRLPKHLAMPSKLVCRGSLQPTSQHAALPGQTSSPLVAETLGGLAEDTIRTITNISRAIENRCGTSDSTPTTSHLFGRVAVALWRGNASLWLHRLPTIPPSLDGVA